MDANSYRNLSQTFRALELVRSKLSLSHSATLKGKRGGWRLCTLINTPFLAAFGLAFSISVPTLSAFMLTLNRA